MKVPVYNIEGKKTSSKELSADVFGIEPNDRAIYLDVKRYLAAQRQGTHKAKERAEVKGSTRKIERRRAPVVPVPAPWCSSWVEVPSLAPSPEVRHQAQQEGDQARSQERQPYKARGRHPHREGTVHGRPEDEGPLTPLASLVSLTRRPSWSFRRAALYLSSRNLPKHRVMTAGDLSTYDIMNCRQIVFVDDAHEVILAFSPPEVMKNILIKPLIARR